jgi:hypothetical protein
MSSVVPPGSEGAAPRSPIEQVIEMLRQAIALLDAEGAPPELAACVQEAVDKVSAFAAA